MSERAGSLNTPAYAMQVERERDEAQAALLMANRTVERMRGLLQETKKAMLGYPMSTRCLSSSALLAGINDVLREGEKK